MNKKILSLSLLGASAFLIANAQALTLDEIETKAKQCDENAVSTVDMADCENIRIEGYETILKEQTKEQLKNSAFSNAYKKWDNFNKKMALYVGQRNGGSIDDVNATNFITNEKLNMIKQLQDNYWSNYREDYDTSKIVEQYNSCIKSAGSITEACLSTAYKAADTLLNANYKYAMNECFENNEGDAENIKNCKSALKAGEVAWIGYKDAYAEFLAAKNNIEISQIFLINTTLRQAELLGPRPEGDVY